MRRVLLVIAATLGAIYVVSRQEGETPTPPASPQYRVAAESFRLVHAVGNSEKHLATGLSKRDCEQQRDERKFIAAVLASGGSITCLPENLFRD